MHNKRLCGQKHVPTHSSQISGNRVADSARLSKFAYERLAKKDVGDGVHHHADMKHHPDMKHPQKQKSARESARGLVFVVACVGKQHGQTFVAPFWLQGKQNNFARVFGGSGDDTVCLEDLFGARIGMTTAFHICVGKPKSFKKSARVVFLHLPQKNESVGRLAGRLSQKTWAFLHKCEMRLSCRCVLRKGLPSTHYHRCYPQNSCEIILFSLQHH